MSGETVNASGSQFCLLTDQYLMAGQAPILIKR
jgi:hypothetical protein